MIRLYQATTADIDLIRDIAEKTWFVTYGEILSPDQMDYMFHLMYSIESIKSQMTELNHFFFIACINDRPLGYVSVEKQQEGLFHLHKLYILPDVQGQGIGKALFNEACVFAKKNSSGETCTLELNMNRENKALHFYQKMGMYIHDSGDFPIGNGFFMNDYILRIDL